MRTKSPYASPAVWHAIVRPTIDESDDSRVVPEIAMAAVSANRMLHMPAVQHALHRLVSPTYIDSHDQDLT